MSLNRNSNVPLYLQLKNLIISKIKSGELKPGSVMQTENDICKTYKISRYPVRQAMGELVAEGYLTRKRGKGTFVTDKAPTFQSRDKSKVVGLILPNLGPGFNANILTGFEKQCRKRGYLLISSSCDLSSEEETACIEKMIEAQVSGFFIFPSNDSKLPEYMDEITEKGIYVGLLDRNIGMKDMDYVGSDNQGGTYSAVRYVASQGFQNVAFVSDMNDISSVRERLEGYLKAVEDFGLKSVNHFDVEQDCSNFYQSRHRFFIERMREHLIELKESLPVGIIASNDFIAMQCMNVIREEGWIIGQDVALVGFDNIVESEFSEPPLTTVAQNGMLLGQNAANIMLDKIEQKATHIYKSIIPTQLVIRKT